jgi:hypothetical protein
MKDGVGAVGVEVDLDPRLDEMRPQRAWWDLQFQRPVGHAIVVLDLALLLNAQDLVEIHARNRREGRAGLGGGNGEARIMRGQIDLANVRIAALRSLPEQIACPAAMRLRRSRVRHARRTSRA